MNLATIQKTREEKKLADLDKDQGETT